MKSSPEHEGERAVCVPHPPGVPYGLCPDCAGDDGDGEENGAYFRSGAGEPVPRAGAPGEVEDAADGGNHEGDETGEDDGHMEVEETLDYAHHPLSRGELGR